MIQSVSAHDHIVVGYVLTSSNIHPGNLPVTLDVARFDHNPGVHNLSILATSMLGEAAEFGFAFDIPSI